MRDRTTAFRVKRGFGVAMMVLFLVFAMLPIVWVLIMAFRPPTHIFEPIWQSPFALTFDHLASLARSEFPAEI